MSKTSLIADEIHNYLCHLAILSNINCKEEGEVGVYSALSFGTPSSAKYSIVDDSICVDLDFSSCTWDIDFDGTQLLENRISKISNYEMSRKTLYGKRNRGFINLLDKDFVDFNELSNVLLEKYGISLNLSYNSNVYYSDMTYGSEDRESTLNYVSYEITSHMMLQGKVPSLRKNEENKLVLN